MNSVCEVKKKYNSTAFYTPACITVLNTVGTELAKVFFTTCMCVAGPENVFSTANTPFLTSMHSHAKNLSLDTVSKQCVCFLHKCVLKFFLFNFSLQCGQITMTFLDLPCMLGPGDFIIVYTMCRLSTLYV